MPLFTIATPCGAISGSAGAAPARSAHMGFRSAVRVLQEAIKPLGAQKHVGRVNPGERRFLQSRLVRLQFPDRLVQKIPGQILEEARPAVAAFLQQAAENVDPCGQPKSLGMNFSRPKWWRVF